MFSIIVLPAPKASCSGTANKSRAGTILEVSKNCLIDPGQVSGRLSEGPEFKEQQALDWPRTLGYYYPVQHKRSRSIEGIF